MKKEYYVLSVALLLFFILATASMMQKSVTYDEAAHIGAGLSYWKTGDFRLNTEHPPLAKLIAGFPLWVTGKTIDTKDAAWQNSEEWLFGKKVLFQWNEYRKTLFLARLPMVLLGMLLCFYIFLFAKEFYGEKSAWIALVFAVLSPEFLAHSTIVTTDLALTTFMFITFYYFWKYLNEKKSKYLYSCSAFLGLSLATKFSAIFILPLMMITAFLWCWIQKKSFFKSFHEFGSAKQKSIAVLIVLFIISAAYFFQGIENYFAGLEQVVIQAQGVERSINQYLLGEFSKTGWRYYFPFAFLFKTSLVPLFFFFVFLIFFILAIAGIQKRERYKEEIFLLVPFFGWMIFFMFTSLNIGVRHILPVYPFFFMMASSVVLVDFNFLWKKIEQHKQKIIMIFLMLYAVSSFSSYPDYLAFFSEAIGSQDGHKYLLDSNIDWGQDLYGLNKWMKKNNAEKIMLFYFGNDEPSYYKMQYDPIPCFAKEGIIAISVNARYGLIDNTERCFNWLDMYSPLTNIGNSILIYNITEAKIRPEKEGQCELLCRKSCAEQQKIYLGHEVKEQINKDMKGQCDCYCKKE